MQMLLLGREGDPADPQSMPLWLGPYTVSHTPIPEPYPGPAALIPRQDYPIWDAALKQYIEYVLVPRYQAALNAQHGVSYSSDFWGILLKPWLIRIVNISWYHYQHVQALVTQHPGPFKVVLHNPDATWESKDTFDFIYHALPDIDFHHWVLSVFLMPHTTDDWQVTHSSFQGRKADLSKSHESVKDYRARRCFSVKGMSDYQEVLLSLLCRFKPPIAPQRANPIPKVKHALPEDYITGLDHLLERCLPLSFDRFFHRFDRRAKRKRYRKGKCRLVGPVVVLYEQTKFYLAHAKEHGEILMSNQHGGSYGQIKVHLEPPTLEYTLDYFISWGWTSAGPISTTILDLPSPYLTSFYNDHNEEEPTVIFVGTDMSPLRACTLESAPNGLGLLQYRNQKKTFFQTLESKVRSHTLYRGYPQSIGSLPDESWITEQIPGLKVVTGDLHQALLRCRLLVLDNPSTSLLIAMAANIPQVSYWDPSVWESTPEAAAIFEDFKRVGMLFDTPQEAAERINALWPSIHDWWQSSEVQAVRETYMRHYARCDHEWFKQWVDTLWTLGTPQVS